MKIALILIISAVISSVFVYEQHREDERRFKKYLEDRRRKRLKFDR